MHVPVNSDPRWHNYSKLAQQRGAFGAALLEMDNEVGVVLAAVEAAGMKEKVRPITRCPNLPLCRPSSARCVASWHGLGSPWLREMGGSLSARWQLMPGVAP